MQSASGRTAAKPGKNVMVQDRVLSHGEHGSMGMDAYQDLVALKRKCQGLQEELRKYTDPDRE